MFWNDVSLSDMNTHSLVLQLVCWVQYMFCLGKNCIYVQILSMLKAQIYVTVSKLLLQSNLNWVYFSAK